MVFHVVQDQLKVSGGWVRCGHCDEVFNALENLFEAEHLPERTPGQTPTVGQDNTLRLREPVGTASEFDSRLYSDFGTTTLLPSHFGPDADGNVRRAPTWDLDRLLKPQPPVRDAAPAPARPLAESPAQARSPAEVAAPVEVATPPDAAPTPSGPVGHAELVATPPAPLPDETPEAPRHAAPDAPPASLRQDTEPATWDAPPADTAPAASPTLTAGPTEGLPDAATGWQQPHLPAPVLDAPPISVPPLPQPQVPGQAGARSTSEDRFSGASEFPSTIAVLEEELPTHRVTQGLHLFDAPPAAAAPTTSPSSPVAEPAQAVEPASPAGRPSGSAAAAPGAAAGQAAAAAGTPATPEAGTMPAFMRENAAGRSWPRHPLARTLAVLLLPALLLLLALQIVIHQRNELATSYVGLRPLLLKLCSTTGCQLESPRMIEQIVLVSSQLQQTGTPGVLLLSAELHNSARHPVLTPSLELSLNDAYGQVLARRVITPPELGASAPDLQPSGSWPVSVHLDVGTLPVAGFTLELFYP